MEKRMWRLVPALVVSCLIASAAPARAMPEDCVETYTQPDHLGAFLTLGNPDCIPPAIVEDKGPFEEPPVLRAFHAWQQREEIGVGDPAFGACVRYGTSLGDLGADVTTKGSCTRAVICSLPHAETVCAFSTRDVVARFSASPSAS